MKTVLVSGAAGSLGCTLTRRLLGLGIDIVGVDNLNDETKSYEEKLMNIEALKLQAQTKRGNLHFYRMDINDKELVEIVCKHRPNTVVHIAARVRDRASVMESAEFVRDNVLGTANLLDAIRSAGCVDNMVVTSSRSAVGEVAKSDGIMRDTDPLLPINPYGATKAAAEHLCHAFHCNHGLPITMLRLNPQVCNRTDMMPRRLLEWLHRGEKIEKYGSGHAVRDWLHPEDTVDAILATAENPMGYEVFTIGTGKGTSLNELLDLAAPIVKKSPFISNLPTPAGDAVFGGIGDFSRIKAKLGWEPKRTLEQGLDELYGYLSDHVF